MRTALARVRGHTPLRLNIGSDQIEVLTLDAHAVEHSVPLADRWVKGFAEVQAAATKLPAAYVLDARIAQQFLKNLPRGPAARKDYWARRHPTGVRPSSRSGAGAIWLSGPERLQPLDPLIRHITRLCVYAQPDIRSSSIWAAELGEHAHIILSLSPDRTRGFSGEEGTLYDLADATLGSEAQTLNRALGALPRFGTEHITTTGMTAERAIRAMS
ncbi:MAG: hypothetical protein ACLP01_18350 [Solirubrobacteraceae bacterium]